jgi:tRNA(Ile)-lysidine synthase
MLDRIANILQHECQLHEKNKLVVGISGGPDSLCLLHALSQLGYDITAVHVNHGLRPEAEKESERVRQFAIGLGIDFIACRIDVRGNSREVSTSIEEAARVLRYRALFEQAKITGASAVVVGHNADDQVETIVMHLLRGSGLAGLRGMEIRTLPTTWSEDIPLVRPLLSTWRKEIQKYVDDHHLNPILDRSNLDVSFVRNRIRHELLPKLQEYNPSIRDVLLRMGRSMKEDYSVLEKLTDNAWNLTYIKQQEGCLAFRTTEFIKLPTSIQSHLLRRAIAYFHPGLQNVDFNCIERGLALLIGEKQNSQTDLVAGLRLIKEGEIFWVATWQADFIGLDFPTLMSGKAVVLLYPSTHNINKYWRLVVEEIDKPELGDLRDEATLDPFQAWLDTCDLDSPLIARVRQPGDQIKPLGLNGHSIKISDLMINEKLSKSARERWPLICSGKEILWVPGFRVSEIARVKPNTSRVVHLAMFRDRAT